MLFLFKQFDRTLMVYELFRDFSPSITCTSTHDINPEQKNYFGFNECISSSISNHSLYTEEVHFGASGDTVVESK